MAFPVILFNHSTGSDTAASGAGPSTALSGTSEAIPVQCLRWTAHRICLELLRMDHMSFGLTLRQPGSSSRFVQ